MIKKFNYLIGLVLIILGIIYALYTFDIIKVNIFFKGWWTLIIIIPSLIGLVNDEDKIPNIAGLVIGILLLLASNKIITYKNVIQLIVPLILVTIGISLILKESLNNNIKKEIREINNQNQKEYYSTFETKKIEADENNIQNSNLNAIFGELIYDLSNITIKNDILITVTSIFGKTTIITPENTNLKIAITPIFGGITNKRKKDKKENEKTIYINGLSMFGSVEIK